MKIFIALVILLFLTPVLNAESMTVDADKFELFQAEQRAEFFGHVVVKRDDMILKADKMTIWYQEIDGKNELKSVKAEGHVIIDTPENKGSANKASFSADSDMLIMTGDARMQSDQGLLVGEQIEYNTTTKDTKVLKGATDNQVHFTFEELAK